MTVRAARCCIAARNSKVAAPIAALHDNFFSSAGKFFQFCLGSFGVHNACKATACREAGAGNGQRVVNAEELPICRAASTGASRGRPAGSPCILDRGGTTGGRCRWSSERRHARAAPCGLRPGRGRRKEDEAFRRRPAWIHAATANGARPFRRSASPGDATDRRRGISRGSATPARFRPRRIGRPLTRPPTDRHTPMRRPATHRS